MKTVPVPIKYSSAYKIVQFVLVAIGLIFANTTVLLKAQTNKPQRIFSDVTFDNLARLVAFEDKYYAVEMINSRILVLNSEQKLLKQIGSIGQEPGAFYEPLDISFDPEGNFYVLDGGNKRIQWFDKDGVVKGLFPIYLKTRGFAVNSKKEIFVGQPQKGTLITMYARNGRVLKNFGELCTPSALYGEMYKKHDDSHWVAMNRIVMGLDHSDNIYVAFHHAPIIRKYSPSGKLIFEKRIEGSGITKLIDIFWNVPVSKIPSGTLSQNIDGIQLLILTKGITIGEKSLYLLLGNDSIVTLDSETGRQFTSIQLPRVNRGSFGTISGRKDEMLYLATFSFGIGSTCYSMKLPLEQTE